MTEMPMKCRGSNMKDEAIQRKTSSSHCVSIHFFNRESPMQCNRELEHFSLCQSYIWLREASAKSEHQKKSLKCRSKLRRTWISENGEKRVWKHRSFKSRGWNSLSVHVMNDPLFYRKRREGIEDRVYSSTYLGGKGFPSHAVKVKFEVSLWPWPFHQWG